MATDFIVHDKADTVGVVVVEDVQPGKEVSGWIMETDETIRFKSLDTVPLGHKIALREIAPGESVIRYGSFIGRASVPIHAGDSVHTHNLAFEETVIGEERAQISDRVVENGRWRSRPDS